MCIIKLKSKYYIIIINYLVILKIKLIIRVNIEKLIRESIIIVINKLIIRINIKELYRKLIIELIIELIVELIIELLIIDWLLVYFRIID